MIYVISTPIGNLADITYRAVARLKEVDYILCEDTRRSGILLKAYDIHAPLFSFHKFSEKKLEEKVIADLKEGKEIALISDAGTPTLSDPGAYLIARCREENLPLTALPGASAPINALVLSGLLTERFQFLGFLPKKGGEKKALLIDVLYYQGVSIFFESPQRVKKTLELLAQIAPKHTLALVREMTKVYEECVRGTAEELLNAHIQGEFVLLIEGKKDPYTHLSPKEHVAILEKEFDLSRQEAIKVCAQQRQIPKRELYSCFISDEEIE
jgi:16S rRNA (cytidine1402-2'-O)-methyltransferase